MIYRNRILLRTVAMTLLFTLSAQLFFPSVSYALTSGPSAPEFSSFEPVDASDMVNMATGDFTYTLPLLEVPSPEGNYPLALSYHAGIEPDQEASWVGLGWTLNAGAINRYVSMFPDDALNDISVIHDEWIGGSSYSWGNGLGIGCFYGGMTLANDTYKGIGIGFNGAVTVPYSQIEGTNGGLGIQFGTNPYGGGYIGVGYSLGTPGTGMSASVNVGAYLTMDADGGVNAFLTAGVGLDYMNSDEKNPFQASLLGASISTANSSGASYSVLGANSSFSNVSVGNVSVQGADAGITIPIPFFDVPVWVSFSTSFQRYFIDNLSDTYAYGSLYFNKVKDLSSTDYGKGTYDIYSLKKPTSHYSDGTDNGGSFPAIDVYSVNAQGIGGSIQPCEFEYATLPETNINKTDRSLYTTQYAGEYQNRVGFRFSNDFSNSFMWDFTGANLSNETNWDYFLGNDSRKVGQNLSNYNMISSSNKVQGFDKDNNQLSSSCDVQYYTNKEISQGSAVDLMLPDNRPSGFSTLGYDLSLDNSIGAFKITNKSGMCYHFALPVYNFIDIQKMSGPDGFSRTITKAMPYAYTWLLTAVTGPDFVDRGVIGKLDDSDYGYWVKFNYGKWTDQYAWRTPNIGTSQDANSDFVTYSYGKKQLYYLNSIETRTHAALFIKDQRKDGRGITSQEYGGFIATLNSGQIQQETAPIAPLKLCKIVLCAKRPLVQWLAENLSVNTLDDFNAVNSSNTTYVQSNTTITAYQWGNVLDSKDLNGLDLGKEIGQKQILFNTDYSLCQGTLNSFDTNADFTPIVAALGGKLTLNSIAEIGLNGDQNLPPTSFAYAKNPVYNQNKVDIWGNYKSDYTVTPNDTKGLNPILPLCTAASSQDVDAWSLTQITSALGATINVGYESDQYFIPQSLANFNNLSIKNILPDLTSGKYLKLYFNSAETLPNIPELNAIPTGGITADIIAGYNIYYSSQEGWSTFGFQNQSATILSIGQDASGSYALLDIHETNNATYNRIVAVTNSSGSGSSSDKYVFNVGNVVLSSSNQNNPRFGGGHRVNSISLFDGQNTYTTTYSYDNGYTSYEPLDLNIHQMGTDFLDAEYDFDAIRDHIYMFYQPVISTAPFLPPPGVLYSTVTISDVVSEKYTSSFTRSFYSEGYSVFNFTTANDLASDIRSDQSLFGNSQKALVKFNDYSNRTGLLKSIIRYRSDGSVLSSNTNSYLHDLSNGDNILSTDFNSQGILDQLYRESKSSGTQNTYTKISQRPVVQIGQTFVDNQRGITTSSKVIGFDFFSGDALATITSDASGNQFMNIMTPAYHVYDNMGLRTDNMSNKHMLSQSAGSVSYKVSLSPGMSEYNVNSYNKLGLVSANANVWGVDLTNNIPYTKASYAWIGSEDQSLNTDGTYPANLYTAFNGSDIAQDGWQLISRVNNYNSFMHPIMSEDVNGNHSAMLMDINNEYVTYTSTNASIDEIAYTGFEFDRYYSTNAITDGNVNYTKGNGISITTGLNANTGNYALSVDQGLQAFNTTINAKANRTYEVGVWVYIPNADNPSLQFFVNNGSTIIPISLLPVKKSGSNYLMKGIFTPTVANVYNISCKNTGNETLYFDDFYVKPVSSNQSIFVYDSNGRISYLLDRDHLYSRYEYDNAGRLTNAYKQIIDPTKEEYLVSKNKINYGGNH